MIGVTTNIVRDIEDGEARNLGGHIFDGVVVAAADGFIGAAGVKGAAN